MGALRLAFRVDLAAYNAGRGGGQYVPMLPAGSERKQASGYVSGDGRSRPGYLCRFDDLLPRGIVQRNPALLPDLGRTRLRFSRQ